MFHITHFLGTDNLHHRRQFGFREGRSCEKALHAMLTSYAETIAHGNYTSLVSLDIQGAFDNVE